MDFSHKIYTVSRLTEEIKDLLEESFPVVWLEGEISNFRVPPSGHYYFLLKDSASQIRAVFFKSGRSVLAFKPEDGLQVLCLGRLSVYPGRGEYQIILERMELKGWGALQLAFEQLKARLLEEGLFDGERKKSLPLLPRKVAVVTSPSGAAIRDFLRILYRRFTNIQVLVFPVLVQGESASFEIEKALDRINRDFQEIEVIVLTRGGGSVEDLWPFNEERVARAIAVSRIPVISAVGHEVDFTISDFVADLRASTPSAAAELLIQPQREWEAKIEDYQNRLFNQIQVRIDRYKEKVFHWQKRLGDPRRRWVDMALRLDDFGVRLRLALQSAARKEEERLRWMRERIISYNPQGRMESSRLRLEGAESNLKALMAKIMVHWEMHLKTQHKTLQALSPWGVLDRGYALVRTLPDLKWIKTVEDAPQGKNIHIDMARAEWDCRVEEAREKEERFLVQRTI
ncbi:MAG: exodeoxyribonuclease VII large subunit [Thermodesulfobacteriota bacterium]